MKVVVYYPKEGEDTKLLEQNAANVHAQAVKQYIEGLPYSKEEKSQMIQEIIEKIRNN